MAVTLNHWGLSAPVVENGKLVAMRAVSGDPDPSPIADNLIDALGSKSRILQPMVRKGYLAGDKGAARGEDSFVAVSWDRAVQLVADQMSEIIAESGNEAIYGGSYGWASAGRFHHAQSQIHRFLNLAGGYVRSVNTLSHAAAEVALPHIIGNDHGMGEHHTPWELIVGHTELFVAFGGLPQRNTQVSAGGVSRHRVPGQLRAAHESGTHFVNIGPLRDDIDASLEPEWIAPRPNTDVALMLALAHVLETEGLADHAFLERCTVGHEEFIAYVTGASDGVAKTPEWAAAISGIEAETIRDLARRMAASRTMISASWALQRADHGEQVIWTTIALAAMLGQIGKPGCGFGFGYSGSNRVGNMPFPFSWPALPQFANKVKAFIPVARVADMLEQPGAPFDYNGGRYTYPDIRMIWWAGGNPFHHQQDLVRLHQVWKKPDCVVVLEPLWNAIARHADIVLPCTMSIERNDLGIAKGEPHLVAMKKAVAPAGQAKSDHGALALIAERMGFASAFTEDRDEMGWLRVLYDEGQSIAATHGYNLPDFDTFWHEGEHRFEQRTEPKSLLEDFCRDTLAHPLNTPSGRIEIRSSRVAGFGYDDCPGLPTWFEPAEWLGNAPEGGLHLISNQPVGKLHSQLDLGAVSLATKISGREAARLNPREAARRGITNGDILRLSSPRGTCLAGAVISEEVADGVIQMATGAWLDLAADGLERHGNVNVLTLDIPTSRLAQGPSAHTTIVFAERFDGPAPAMRAFEPPPIEHEETA